MGDRRTRAWTKHCNDDRHEVDEKWEFRTNETYHISQNLFMMREYAVRSSVDERRWPESRTDLKISEVGPNHLRRIA